MDIAFNQHSSHAKRTTRSFTNLTHVSLAPLTSRLPLSDADLPASPPQQYEHRHTTYLHGRSVPTTPTVLSQSTSRTSLSVYAERSGVIKSKSTAQLPAMSAARDVTGTVTPGRRTSLQQTRRVRDGLQLSRITNQPGEDADRDWLHRAGALMANSARESKGQTWLVSRASSTSLADQADQDGGDADRFTSMIESREASRRASRRGSLSGTCDADDEISPVTTRAGLMFGTGTPPTGSRNGSRINSRHGSKVRLVTPMEMLDRGGYFDLAGNLVDDSCTVDNVIIGPDFVEEQELDLEDDLNDTQHRQQDEATIERLSRANSLGLGALVENLLRWSLFAVDEDGKEIKASIAGNNPDGAVGTTASRRSIQDVGHDPLDDANPAPNADDTNVWQDAAWLLGVASKIIL